MSFASHKRDLLEILLKIKNQSLLDDFLVDLLTPKEMQEIIKRWQLIKHLHQKIPQRQIAKNLKISIAKITRGSRALLNKNGGFNQILQKRKIYI
ncbi:MAG: Trp family transcriptional regulator [Candidatus Magasanikbacteria bacterium]|nr:Trp family transcriptional regulator [Candidatus Magasanikbacteria bacterium]